jgi:diacylglycerol O-acyltransferase / wax synthase
VHGDRQLLTTNAKDTTMSTSNVLDLFDQTFFAGERATGATNLLQTVWVYDRPVDLTRLLQFHRQLRRGRLSRRIERSALPFGRHRWVKATEQSNLEIAAARPRADLDAWLSEQATTPVDSERGPGWHLAVLPFTDGGAGISLVISHCLTDGVGLCEALADAAGGRADPVAWPAAGSRTRWQALREDTRQTGRDIPAIARAIRAATRLARDSGATDTPGTAAYTAPEGADEYITIPTATLFVDADEWDACARALGGTSNTLLEGLAARIAQRVGRVTGDGSVNLGMPVNERTPGDTRANALANVDILVDPRPASADLRGIRAATKQALIHRQEVSDERWAALPVIPLLPKWLVRQLLYTAAGDGTSVGSSNIGAVDPAACRPDGTDADHFAIKNFGPGVTTTIMHRLGGLLSFLSGTANGRVFVSVVAYQPGRIESKEELRALLSSALDEFSLTADIDWPCYETAAA